MNQSNVQETLNYFRYDQVRVIIPFVEQKIDFYSKSQTVKSQLKPYNAGDNKSP